MVKHTYSHRVLQSHNDMTMTTTTTTIILFYLSLSHHNHIIIIFCFPIVVAPRIQSTLYIAFFVIVAVIVYHVNQAMTIYYVEANRGREESLCSGHFFAVLCVPWLASEKKSRELWFIYRQARGINGMNGVARKNYYVKLIFLFTCHN